MPEQQLSLPERAALLALMILIEEASNSEMQARFGFTIDRKVRTSLEGMGYLRSRRSDHLPGRPYVHELTDKGWRHCRSELAAHPPEKAPKAYHLMYGMMNIVDTYMRRSQLAMEHFFGVAEIQYTADLGKRIRSAYEELVAEAGGWIGLRRLRERLADVPPPEVDAALLRLDLQPGIYLEPESNQKTLSDLDRAAAIRIGGEDKHLLSIKPA
jgi:hypothetical protein